MMTMEDINEDLSSSSYSDEMSHDATKHDIEESANKTEISSIKKQANRTWLITFLLVAVGAGASAAFLYMGISGAKDDQQVSFERLASDFSKEIDGAWDDYEAAARWTHSECRNWRTDNFTHQDFEALYHYLVDGGLDFYSINWIPNITHAERPEVEEKEGAFWKTIEGAENYAGFTGQEPDPDHPGELMYANRSEQPYYFPIYFVEPKSAAASVIHYDLFSAPWEAPAISKALETYEPALTGRFVLAQHTEDDGYSTLLYHPGVKLPSHLATGRLDLTTIVMSLNPFLQHAARSQAEPMAVYLYDKTLTEIDGAPPEFLGGVQVTYENGKRNNRTVSNLKETEHEALQESKLYYERPIYVGGRTWTIVVVPVEEDDSFKPDFFFAIFCGVMIFCASLLLAWVWVMHNRRRNEQVLEIVDKAAAESKIVSSLYPEAVRDQMIDQQRASDAENFGAASHDTKDTYRMTESIRQFNMLSEDMSNSGKNIQGIYKTKPLAHLYDATTIMFADLVGFTAWSASRSPEDVFTLLETLYGAFDHIAKKRRVFKVETIGDCYVAVAGLPKPRSDHAFVMCRFANDCLHKMQKVTKVLAEGALGADTADLSFRVGLHSGPVTAGVLRGDKGRFQLFGDTMNTASRMESTGVKNKIQVSQETADLLIEGGYQKCLTPREDLVHAKGKGEVRTYFLNFASGSTISSLSHGGASVNNKSFGSAATEDTGLSDIFQEEHPDITDVVHI